jgi:hypothetical protein
LLAFLLMTESLSMLHSHSLLLVGLGSCIVLSLSFLCANRDFKMGNREKYTLFAGIIMFLYF